MSESSMVEIMESDMDVVKLNQFDLKVFGSGRNIYNIYVHSLLLLISNHHRSNNQPFVNAEK
jgi:hypothetical protein